MHNRIIMGDSTNPWHNLAVEELLFDTYGAEERLFYLWQNAHTVVIGRHQNAWKECRVKLLEDEEGCLARRSSGGGAVYHDLGNLNFTFIAPRQAYDVHRQLEVIRSAVARFGISAVFTGRNDLVVADSGAKFSGNAFRFTDQTGMHHGTVMVNVALDRLSRYLAPDEGKLRAKGIESVRSRVCNLADLSSSITIESLAEAMKESFEQEFGPAETLSVSQLDGDKLVTLEAKYASWDFRLGRALPFDATLEHRFAWGGVTLEMTLREGVITGAKVFSDAMDEAMIGAIAPALTGLKYENAELARALRSLGYSQADELADWLISTDLGGHSS